MIDYITTESVLVLLQHQSRQRHHNVASHTAWSYVLSSHADRPRDASAYPGGWNASLQGLQSWVLEPATFGLANQKSCLMSKTETMPSLPLNSTEVSCTRVDLRASVALTRRADCYQLSRRGILLDVDVLNSLFMAPQNCLQACDDVYKAFWEASKESSNISNKSSPAQKPTSSPLH